MSGSELVAVSMLALPVDLWARSQEQHDALMREFALMSAPAGEEERQRHLPSRLTELMKQLASDFEGVATEQEQRLFAAAAAGEQVLDELIYRVPAAAGPASRRLAEMLDEADEYCRQGEHLLTVAADAELVRFRWWFLDQFSSQVEGAAPVAWPDYRRG